jgi:putative tricarboxylic transport membrane protein
MLKNIIFLIIILFSWFLIPKTHAFSENIEIIEQLTIYVPGAENGGYDYTANALNDVLVQSGLVEKINIVHLAGAGGVLALTYFIHNDFSEEYAILLGGRSMMGAALYNNSSVSIQQTIPLSRLTGKPLAIAVTKKSPIENINDLLEGMSTDTSMIKWIGGSAGAADNVFLKDLFVEMGLDIEELNYHPVPGGGQAVAKKLVSGKYTAAISTLDEFNQAISEQEIRIIALTSMDLIEGLDIPTLKSAGINIAMNDWHGVFISAKTSQTKKKILSELFKKLNKNSTWQKIIKDSHWQNNYIDDDKFLDFINREQTLLISKFTAKKIDSVAKNSFDKQIKNLLRNPYRWASYIAILCAILLITLFILKAKNKNREAKLQRNLKNIEEENRQHKEKLAEKVNGLSKHIEHEFAKWKLTITEKEIALMLLKGLTFKEIAEVRSKSERTVRQQAGAIYAKSSLSNRSDLAAYFLEDLMAP